MESWYIIFLKFCKIFELIKKGSNLFNNIGGSYMGSKYPILPLEKLSNLKDLKS